MPPVRSAALRFRDLTMILVPLKFLIFSVVLFPLTAWAGTFDQDFAVVYIDARAEVEFGGVPLSREVLSRGIDRIAQAGARGLVLKFFLDQAKDERGDGMLADSLSRLPTLLQARLDNKEAHPNVLASRFTLVGSFNVAAAGSSAWISSGVTARRSTPPSASILLTARPCSNSAGVS